MRPSPIVPVLFLLLAAAPAGARVQAPPELVAPGDPAQPTVADACPTFHWGLETPAVALELAVYRLPPAAEERSGDPQGVVLVAQRRLPGTARGWTPPLDGCFPPGSYGWLLRERRGEEVGPWSEIYLFEVPSMPSPGELARALAVLERYVAGGGAPEALARGAEGGLAGTAGSLPGSQPGFTDEPAPAAFPRALAIPEVTGFRANPSETEGVVFGAQGVSQSTGTGSAGVVGQSTAVSGAVAGVYGQAASAAGAAGVFDNTGGGSILRGLSDGVEVFAVGGDGHVTAASFEGDGSELTNLPAGTASDLDCVGCVDTPQLADGAVAEVKLAFDPATQTELDGEAATRAAADTALAGDLGAHQISGDHDSRYVNRAGDSMSGDLDLTGTVGVTREDAASAAVTDVLTLAHTTSGVAAGGIGAGLLLRAENAGGELADAGQVAVVLSDAGAGSEASELRFLTRTAGGALTQAAALDGEGRLSAAAFAGDGSELTNLPAGTASDLDCVGCVDTQQLADGAVAEVKLAFDPATQTELDGEAATRAAADVTLADAQLGLTLLITGTANVVTFEDFLIESIYDIGGTADPIYLVSINRDRNQHRVGQALSYQILQKDGSDYWNLNTYLRVVNEDPDGGYSAVQYKVWRLE